MNTFRRANFLVVVIGIIAVSISAVRCEEQIEIKVSLKNEEYIFVPKETINLKQSRISLYQYDPITKEWVSVWSIIHVGEQRMEVDSFKYGELLPNFSQQKKPNDLNLYSLYAISVSGISFVASGEFYLVEFGPTIKVVSLGISDKSPTELVKLIEAARSQRQQKPSIHKSVN